MKNVEEKQKVVAGVDVAKGELVVRGSWDTNVVRFENTQNGVRKLIKVLKDQSVTLVVCEHTGRYERLLVLALFSKGLPVHCAHPKAVHHFAKARKATAKSDPIDAETIMQYGIAMDLKPDQPPSTAFQALQELASRRDDLREMLVMEKNRLKAPGISSALKKDIREMIQVLEKRLQRNEEAMENLIKKEPSLAAPIEILRKQHGVGLISAVLLYASMPELGTLTRQTSASLAGLAPILRDSGKYSGQRRIGGGRTLARNALYMVAMAAIRKKDGVLQKLYLNLRKAGKRRMVALTAVMRKLIIRLNTVLKDLYKEPQAQAA